MHKYSNFLCDFNHLLVVIFHFISSYSKLLVWIYLSLLFFKVIFKNQQKNWNASVETVTVNWFHLNQLEEKKNHFLLNIFIYFISLLELVSEWMMLYHFQMLLCLVLRLILVYLMRNLSSTEGRFVILISKILKN